MVKCFFGIYEVLGLIRVSGEGGGFNLFFWVLEFFRFIDLKWLVLLECGYVFFREVSKI